MIIKALVKVIGTFRQFTNNHIFRTNQLKLDFHTLTQKLRQHVIYDLGSNNGDDIPYYLKKGEIVVAVEANPLLCREIESKYSREIASGQLFVENCVLTADGSVNEVYFYIHKFEHFLSQFPKPKNTKNFEKVLLPSKSVLDLISTYGNPYYIKIDLEHYDAVILKILFDSNIRPPFISAEAHNIEVFALMVSLGGYDSFKLVDGETVSSNYKNHKISVKDKQEIYSFPHNSAGPFGNDIKGPWMDANSFFSLLAIEGLGWKDIHATNQE